MVGIFGRVSDWFKKGLNVANNYAPMLAGALRSPYAKMILGDRAGAIADIVEKVSEKLPGIQKAIYG